MCVGGGGKVEVQGVHSAPGRAGSQRALAEGVRGGAAAGRRRSAGGALSSGEWWVGRHGRGGRPGAGGDVVPLARSGARVRAALAGQEPAVS